jgi:hypothetical protein
MPAQRSGNIDRRVSGTGDPDHELMDKFHAGLDALFQTFLKLSSTGSHYETALNK